MQVLRLLARARAGLRDPQALNDGTLARERWDSYCKLQRELRALEIRKDARLRSEARKERARFARSRRKTVY